jgi:phosphate/sulfate permease
MEKNMPESFSIWFPWLLSALTGGLAAAILNLVANWLRAKKDKKQAKVAQINALKQEFLHALWLIEYNHQRIESKEIRHKALTSIDTSNGERVLFGIAILLPLKPEIQLKLRDYFQQTVYLNRLVAEYVAIMPSNPLTTNRLNAVLGEIKAICTPNPTYKDRPELSLRAHVEQLLNELEEIKT